MGSRPRGMALAAFVFGLGIGVLTTACTIDPPEGTPPPPLAGALEPGPREMTFGRTGDEVVNNPQLRDRIHSLFGTDWSADGKIRRGAAPYFGRTTPPRGVRVGDKNYIAVTGCVPQNCQGDRVLLLVQEGGEAMLARLDEGGFSHYYAYGGDWGPAGSTQRIVDAAMRALSRPGDPYPRV
ncbi:MAG TPA: hypothetical protein VL086_03180 [Candidatus Nitrosotalea sp.]|nr:hypothetical protein [Candidatus Nitrosotalea sp.]